MIWLALGGVSWLGVLAWRWVLSLHPSADLQVKPIADNKALRCWITTTAAYEFVDTGLPFLEARLWFTERRLRRDAERSRRISERFR